MDATIRNAGFIIAVDTVNLMYGTYTLVDTIRKNMGGETDRDTGIISIHLMVLVVLFDVFLFVWSIRYMIRMVRKDMIKQFDEMRKESKRADKKIWDEIYLFQNTLHDLPQNEDKLKELGLYVTYGKYGEKLYINEDMSKQLFMYRMMNM